MNNQTKKTPRKGLMFQISALLVIGALITGTVLLNTFTKFTSTQKAEDTARVTKFDYNIMEDTRDLSNGAIDIFGTTTNDTGIYGSSDTDSSGKKLVGPGVEGEFTLTFNNLSEVAVRASFDTLNYVNDGNIPLIYFFNGNYYSDLIGLYHQEKSATEYSYFRHDEEQGNGITLNGNMSDFIQALNEYKTYSEASISINGAAILDATNKTDATTSTVDIKWFWPYEAKLKDVDGKTESANESYTVSGSVYKAYKFDAYDTSLASGTATVTMEPVVRITQLDTYATPSQASSGGFQSWSSAAAPN